MLSIAEARNQLTALIHQAETGLPITICRRGKPVAVVLSVAEYDRLTQAKAPEPDGWTRLLTVRETLTQAESLPDWTDAEIRSWRDESPGRPVMAEDFAGYTGLLIENWFSAAE